MRFSLFFRTTDNTSILIQVWFITTISKSYLRKDLEEIGLYISRVLIHFTKYFKGYRISETQHSKDSLLLNDTQNTSSESRPISFRMKLINDQFFLNP